MYTRNKLIEENGNEKTFSLSDRYAFCPNINAGATANSCWNIHLNVPRRQAMTSSSFSAARTTTSAGASKAAKIQRLHRRRNFSGGNADQRAETGNLGKRKKYVYRPSPVLHLTKRKPNALMPDWKRWKRNAAPDRKNFTFYPKPLYRNLLCRLIKRHLHKTRSFRMRINSQNTGKH